MVKIERNSWPLPNITVSLKEIIHREEKHKLIHETTGRVNFSRIVNKQMRIKQVLHMTKTTYGSNKCEFFNGNSKC